MSDRTRFLMVFLSVQAALFTAVLTAPVRKVFVIPFTEAIAALAGALVSSFDPKVKAQGIMLLNAESGFSVRIEAGCNGLEPIILMVAAILAFRATWQQKVLGIAVGIIAIQALNQARIISLYYLGQYNQQIFEWFHLYIWQALILVDALIVWLLWVRHVRTNQNASV